MPRLTFPLALLLVAFVAALLFLPFPAPAATIDAGLYPGLDQVVTAEMNKTHTPGADIVIIRNGSIVYARGFGTFTDRVGTMNNTSVPMTPDTVIPIDSTTKFFTGYIFASLVEDGSLDPNTSVRTYIPELDPSFDTVTMQELITHTAGLSDLGVTGFPPTIEEKDNPVAYMHWFNRSMFFAPPGEVLAYSNHGFNIAGFAEARAAGSTYSNLVRDRITGPLLMNNTSVRTGAYAFAPSGEIVSTGNDLARLALAYMDAGNGSMTLRPGAVRRMTDYTVPVPGSRITNSRYGYGIILRSFGNLTEAGHTGDGVESTCTFAMIPQQRFAVIMNVYTPSDEELPETFSWILHRTFPYITREPAPELLPVPPDNAKRISGTYQGTGGNAYRIYQNGTTLVASIPDPNLAAVLTGDENITLYRISTTKSGGYWLQAMQGSAPLAIDFVNGPDGSVKYLCIGVRVYPLIEHGSRQEEAAAPGILHMPHISFPMDNLLTGKKPAGGH